jgi:hypothetical protein
VKILQCKGCVDTEGEACLIVVDLPEEGENLIFPTLCPWGLGIVEYKEVL